MEPATMPIIQVIVPGPGTFITLVTIALMVLGTALTLVWFIRDMRRENGKILKAIQEGQKIQTEILIKIEEGQRRMEEGQRRMEEGQRRMEEVQMEWSKTMIRILAKIEENTRK